MADKSFYVMKDQGSIFYDMEHEQGLAGNKVGLLVNSGRVATAERQGQIVKLDKEEGKRRMKEQEDAEKKEQDAQAKAGGNPAAPVAPATTETVVTETEEDADPAIEEDKAVKKNSGNTARK